VKTASDNAVAVALFQGKNIQAVFSSPEKGKNCIVARFGFIWQIMSNR
jgi:hypothetical protein